MHILNLTCSATGCKRNWSVFDQVHTKRRIQLEQSKLHALVFVKYNLALEARQVNMMESGDNYNPIILEESDPKNEWICEIEEPALDPNDLSWMDVREPFEVETQPSGSSRKRKGMFKTASLILLVVLLAWAYQAIQPPPPKICGSPGGPPVTAPRVKISDGRYLAYKEHGVPKDKAKYKIIISHGFGNCRHDVTFITQEFSEELGIYSVSFDRAGYGESDPNPKQSVKSTALDIEELADQLDLGSKFYVIGFSMGGQAVWGCLKYIPHRLAGAALLAPVINYWWPGFPANLSKEAYNQQLMQDQWTLRVSHYLPWLTYWWNTQKWFPASSVAAQKLEVFSPADRKLFYKLEARKSYLGQITQQGEFESLHRDLIIGFGNWEFDPMDLENSFPEGSIHLWHGDDDLIVPVTLQRYIVEKLTWIQYHELPNAGHIFPHADGMGEVILKALLLGEIPV